MQKKTIESDIIIKKQITYVSAEAKSYNKSMIHDTIYQRKIIKEAKDC
jgi:hypothetical protein